VDTLAGTVRAEYVMNTLLGNTIPIYVKLVATGLLAATYLSALGVALDIYIAHGPNAALPNVVSFVLGTGLGAAIQVLGIHVGAALTRGSNDASS